MFLPMGWGAGFILHAARRGELEITDVNSTTLEEGKMQWDVLKGWWSDAGTFESLQAAGNMVEKTGANKSDG